MEWHPGYIGAEEDGTILLLLSQKITYLHITHHAGLSKMRSSSMFHKALFPTSPKGRLNFLEHFLDGQITFKVNGLYSGK